MKLHPTKNDLPANAKSAMIALMNEMLAVTIDLSLVTKQAHWNIKGPHFIAIHEMLDDFRENLDEHVDTIAERIAQLGGAALGTVQTVSEKTSLKAYPTDIFTTKDHLDALIERFAMVSSLIRKAIKDAAETGDDVTADVFTAAAGELDKSLWFLEAHIQEKN